MLEKQRHQVNLRNILVNLYKDSRLANTLVFKGGTAAYFFYDLPRFSTDLDFDMLFTGVHEKDVEEYVFDKISETIEKLKFTIVDKKNKRNTLFWLISYEKFNVNIKVEVSKRTLEMMPDELPDYEARNYYGESVLVVTAGSLIAQKLIAIQGRRFLANRDLFDVHYFLNSKHVSEIDYRYIERQTGKNRKQFLRDLYRYLGTIKQSPKLMNGLGEVLDENQGEWVKTRLIVELRNSVAILLDSLS